jgi:hypothetical protein
VSAADALAYGLADALLWRFPVAKAAGGGARLREDLAAELRPACAGLADLEARIAGIEAGVAVNARRLGELAGMSWPVSGDSVAVPYPARTAPFRPGEWDVRLTPAGGSG